MRFSAVAYVETDNGEDGTAEKTDESVPGDKGMHVECHSQKPENV